jgi:hypothetical protein
VFSAAGCCGWRLLGCLGEGSSRGDGGSSSSRPLLSSPSLTAALRPAGLPPRSAQPHPPPYPHPPRSFTFMVHPNAWIVHRQHDRSGADKLYQSQKKEYEFQVKQNPRKGDENTSLAGMTHRFRDRILLELARGVYAPVVDDGVKGCVASLPWWRADGKGHSYDDEYDR